LAFLGHKLDDDEGVAIRENEEGEELVGLELEAENFCEQEVVAAEGEEKEEEEREEYELTDLG